jgi:hypothetical protein
MPEMKHMAGAVTIVPSHEIRQTKRKPTVPEWRAFEINYNPTSMVACMKFGALPAIASGPSATKALTQ